MQLHKNLPQKQGSLWEFVKTCFGIIFAFILPVYRIPKYLVFLHYDYFGQLCIDILCMGIVITLLAVFKVWWPIIGIGSLFGMSFIAGISCRLHGKKFYTPLPPEIEQEPATNVRNINIYPPEDDPARQSKFAAPSRSESQGRKLVLPPISVVKSEIINTPPLQYSMPKSKAKNVPVEIPDWDENDERWAAWIAQNPSMIRCSKQNKTD